MPPTSRTNGRRCERRVAKSESFQTIQHRIGMVVSSITRRGPRRSTETEQIRNDELTLVGESVIAPAPESARRGETVQQEQHRARRAEPADVQSGIQLDGARRRPAERKPASRTSEPPRPRDQRGPDGPNSSQCPF